MKLRTESGKPVQQLLAELGTHANQLRTWRNEQESEPLERAAAFPVRRLCRLVGVAVRSFDARLRR